MMPIFNLSNKLCNVTKMEAVDEEENLIEDLEVSLEENKIKPKEVLVKKEYNFKLKAYVNGGYITMSTNKTLRFGYE